MKRHPITRVRCAIKKSSIHGRGTFATTNIRSGTRIVEYIGEIVSATESDYRANEESHTWLFDLEDGYFIDGDKKMPGPCINHSCEPNCETEIIDSRVFIRSSRAIKNSEELTYDYRFEPDAEIWPCNCGSGRCRGTINLKLRKKRKAAPKKKR